MKKKSIREQRFEAVAEILLKYDIKSVLEFGCGDGKFLPYLNNIKKVNRIAVVDKDEKKINKIKKAFTNVNSYCKSFLEYHDEFEGFESIVAIEVIEHLDERELLEFINVVFLKLQPKIIVFTTPNKEYNINYPVLYDGLRHSTHVFEFSPVQLEKWGKEIIGKFKKYEFCVGFCDEGGSSQIIVFNRRYS